MRMISVKGDVLCMLVVVFSTNLSAPGFRSVREQFVFREDKDIDAL
jgi:hypothetical protein